MATKQEALRQQTLIQVSRQTREPSFFFTDMHFWNVKNFTTRQVQIDIVRESIEIAKFRSPMADPNVVARDPWDRQTHSAPYIHESVPLSPDDLTYVRPGEDPFSETTLVARLIESMAEDAVLLKGRVKRRIEVMAATLLNGGKITIVGDGIPSFTLDFKMPAGNKFTLTGNDRWSQVSTSTPMDDLRLVLRTIGQASGKRPSAMYWGSDAFDLALRHDDFLNYLDKRNANFVKIEPQHLPRGVAHVGEFEGVQMFTYDETYTEDGVSKRYLPEKRILFGSTDAECVRAHGAILNFNALKPVDYYISEVREPRGKKIYRDIESSPLLGLSESNAFGYLIVDTES